MVNRETCVEALPPLQATAFPPLRLPATPPAPAAGAGVLRPQPPLPRPPPPPLQLPRGPLRTAGGTAGGPEAPSPVPTVAKEVATSEQGMATPGRRGPRRTPALCRAPVFMKMRMERFTNEEVIMCVVYVVILLCLKSAHHQ